MIVVSVCLPSDALSQHLPSYLGFSYLGRGVSLHGCSSKVQLLPLTLDVGYLLTATATDLGHGVSPWLLAAQLLLAFFEFHFIGHIPENLVTESKDMQCVCVYICIYVSVYVCTCVFV